MAVSPDCSAAQPCFPSRDAGQSLSEILQPLRQRLVQDDAPPVQHKYLCQIILEDRAECATWLLEVPSCGNSPCRANLCFLSEDRLPSEKHRKLISGLGVESRFAFFPRLKLPSSVILVWAIPGTRCSSFLQMQTWIRKPSFPLSTPSARWDFPSFVKIVTYKRRKVLRAVHHVYFTWYVFALAITQAVFMPNYSSICSPTPIFCAAYVEHLVLKVSQFLNIF